ncbi:hypothetical protein ACFP7A_07645 [Sporolactobacillus kofuensis]|uniref:DUF1643 domain-containing protein n=1 Tax=Sporolactobacillus kofuensis TaxID=269672 RepID=A0ABW1WFN2_9BACL|nr:hypothetical protein [Sporolactobacillus kofuensis]MCO7175806.1 hypothetical protein [Sporolactobacillus kofuensis]
MDHPRAFGRFIFRFGHVFRTSAYIQWGHSSRSLGAVLMLNPGSAQFEQTNPKLDAQLRKYGAAMGPIKEDPTIAQLTKLVHELYRGHPSGTLQIYNLFHLQAAKSADAIALFEQFVNEHKLMLTESLATKDELQRHPWMLIGWGIRSHSSWHNLEEIKKLWLEQIKAAGILTFGKRNARGDYYHPCPQLQAQKDKLTSELKELFDTKVKPFIPYEEFVQHRYTVLKWNGKSDVDAQFIVKDNTKNVQCVFVQGHEPVWFHLELDKDPAVSHWHNDQMRSVDDLRGLVP